MGSLYIHPIADKVASQKLGFWCFELLRNIEASLVITSDSQKFTSHSCYGYCRITQQRLGGG